MTVRWDAKKSINAIIVSCETEGGCHKAEIMCDRDAAFVLKNRLSAALSVGGEQTSEAVAFLHGFGAAMYEMLRLTSRPDLVLEAMRAHNVSLDKLRAVDIAAYQRTALEARLK